MKRKLSGWWQFLVVFGLIFQVPQSMDWERAQAPQSHTSKNGFVLGSQEMPDEIMLEIFKYLPVKDILCAAQVCKGWYELAEAPHLWMVVRQTILGDYPATQATRENAKLHLLRVLVNTLSNVERIEQLVNKYQLNQNHPFMDYQRLVTANFYDPDVRGGYLFLAKIAIEEKAAQGIKWAIKAKNKPKIACLYSRFENAPAIDADLNDKLAEQGEEDAIERQLEGLAYGLYGYPYDPVKAANLNEKLFLKGNKNAISRRVLGIYHDWYGYKRNFAYLIQWLDEEESKGTRWAYYVKAQAHKYKIAGFDKGREAAIDYIKKYSLPY